MKVRLVNFQTPIKGTTGEAVDPRDLTNLATFARRIGFSYSGLIKRQKTWNDFPQPIVELPGTAGMMQYYLLTELDDHHRRVTDRQMKPRWEKQARSALFHHLLRRITGNSARRTLATRMTTEGIKKYGSAIDACKAIDIDYVNFDPSTASHTVISADYHAFTPHRPSDTVARRGDQQSEAASSLWL
jgi:hypothetical protein